MWLITPVGFFSVVQKASDVTADTLTVRARVRGDLDALREQYLPALGEVQESKTNDYRFRAVAPRADVAAAMASLVSQLKYSNFKSQVAKVQGNARAHLYHDVSDVLHRLQTEPAKYQAAPKPIQPSGPVFHPKVGEQDKHVELRKPSHPSPLTAWSDAKAIACVIPDGPMPGEINGVSALTWSAAPSSAQDWEALAATTAVPEPEFKVPAGYKKAAGVVIREPDGRVWVVAPSNGFGGYKATFPKGTMDGMSTQATALVEAYEESGLQVRLRKHLVDVKRSQSYTRYFLAERLGGNPADMGWESQAVMLVPVEQLAQVLNSPNDVPIMDALKQV
ncbi:NUDIX hydrolase [Acidovorax sp. RAC01]|uniref:NUDIX hydrolase n=1 Tax=Acidovorax sp. RAC01 TaxID=1842533 RepID=UPI0008560206|nr:NUDIX hydrolase [Acidovorax sp. RAC01]AOG24587.1 NUDIX domain protein [Acidovorax sp. RAC01]